MHIIHHAHLSSQQADGVRSLLASDNLSFEIRLIELVPGAHLPADRHEGERVVVVLAGQGKLLLPTGPQRFVAPSSLFIPPHESYQIVNNGGTELRLVMVSSLGGMWPRASAAMALSGDVCDGPDGNTDAMPSNHAKACQLWKHL